VSLKAEHQVSLDALESALRNAQEPSLDLLMQIKSSVCTRILHLAKTETIDRLFHLAQIGAWTDAALALIELELPFWRVRRLAYENGEWLCSLSCRPNLPLTIDDCAEATHEILPLAMLCAFVEACRKRYTMRESVSIVPRIQLWPEQTICCENYR
jgi:hypothetical protein